MSRAVCIDARAAAWLHEVIINVRQLSWELESHLNYQPLSPNPSSIFLIMKTSTYITPAILFALSQTGFTNAQDDDLPIITLSDDENFNFDILTGLR